MAACLCLSASARPPAMLPPLFRAFVFGAESPPPTPAPPPPAYPLSRGFGGGAGFLPAGRLVGGSGGAPLPRMVVADTLLVAAEPFAVAGNDDATGRVGRDGGAGGGAGREATMCSSR